MDKKISVVIPTYNRIGLLRQTLSYLEKQTLPADEFEVIVAVDGATDGTTEWLKGYAPPFVCRYFTQENKGASAARNLGMRNAAAAIVLCLDDDAAAAPQLLEEHWLAHQRDPGHAVQGALAVHESVPRTAFTRYQERRLEEFRRQMLQPGAALSTLDVASGNFSCSRERMQAVGGFNEDLKDLTDTDGELAYRLQRAGAKFAYAPLAVVYLAHLKNLEQNLREAFLYGRTYVYMQRRFPETVWSHSPWVYDRHSPLRNALRAYLCRYARNGGRFPRLGGVLAALVKGAEVLRFDALAAILYRLIHDYYFWQGAHEESGGRLNFYRPRGISILCYHDVTGERRAAYRLYMLPPRRFFFQMRWLRRLGFRVVSLDQLHAYLARGAPLPEKAVAVTFDDGYRALRDVTPRLAAMGLPHTHFINTARLGQTTGWIEEAPDLPLLSADEAASLAQRHGQWVDFQPHGRTHLPLARQAPETVREEIAGSAADIARLLGRPARYLAYPYGDYDDAAAGIAAGAGLAAAFTVDQGLCRPGQNPFLLPRVEIFSNDLFLDFVCKLYFGWSPIAALRTALKRRYKKIMRLFRRAGS